MAWETRNGRGRYLTKTRRQGGRYIREYLGSGPMAELMAEVDAEERRLRELGRQAWLQERAELAERDRDLEAFCQEVELLARAALVLAGYHQHDRGEWRRYREPKAAG